MKKKIANLQKQHGAKPEYIMILKNNVQNSGKKNPSPTGGLYMVCGEGKLFSEFLKNGIKFDDQFVIMANQGGRTWQTFVGGKNGHENFRQARIYDFRNKCVVFARNRKFAKSTQ